MSDKGFFKVDRALFEHWLWSKRPFADGQAWIDLIGLANHKDIKRVKNGVTTVFKRGTVNRSMKELAARWGWDRRRVKRFLIDLEADGMVLLNSTRNGAQQGTRIVLVNYGRFQNDSTRNGTQVMPRNVHGMYTDCTQTRMIKNEKNEKNNDVARARVREGDQPQHPPTLADVRAYFEAAGLTTSPESFWRHYDANGWRLAGGDPVRNWKLAAQKWRDYVRDETQEANPDRNPRQRDGYGEAEAELFG